MVGEGRAAGQGHSPLRAAGKGLSPHSLCACLPARPSPTHSVLVCNELRCHNVHARFLELFSATHTVRKVPASKMDAVYQHPAIELYLLKKKRPGAGAGVGLAGDDVADADVDTEGGGGEEGAGIALPSGATLSSCSPDTDAAAGGRGGGGGRDGGDGVSGGVAGASAPTCPTLQGSNSSSKPGGGHAIVAAQCRPLQGQQGLANEGTSQVAETEAELGTAGEADADADALADAGSESVAVAASGAQLESWKARRMGAMAAKLLTQVKLPSQVE